MSFVNAVMEVVISARDLVHHLEEDNSSQSSPEVIKLRKFIETNLRHTLPTVSKQVTERYREVYED